MSGITNLEMAADRLCSMEQLLLRPTPQAVREADALLQEVAGLIAELDSKVNLPEAYTRKGVDDFRVLCDRVSKLLEGARRVQWIRMRLITGLAQTYSARAEMKTWSPPSGTVNVSM